MPNEQVFAFPNPARQSTTLRFMTTLLPLEAQIRIFDIAGSLVKELSIASGEIVAAPGSGASVYHANWDLTNSKGAGVASGVYLFAVKVKGGNDQTALVIKKLAVVK
ncbi:MAG: T9SS type A sorting domain-containing protein [Elusimicrobia bacterium]|nr:T9SS type A sorting domain-containing protein [Elusimicrobiota bacterium]